MRNLKYVVLAASCCLSLAATVALGQTRILPLGDSVTSSFAPLPSYRYWLWHELQDAGFNVDFVGTQSGVANGTPEFTDYDMDHEGHPGWTTQDAADNIASIAAETQPDVVLLDLGSNDVEQGLPASTTMSNLEFIIESLRAVNPNVIVLMAQPTPFIGQNQLATMQMRMAINRAARVENERNSRVILVNLAAGYAPRVFTDDGTHPNQKGEQLIARRFFAVLKAIRREL